jgi:hypothetical protein
MSDIPPLPETLTKLIFEWAKNADRQETLEYQMHALMLSVASTRVVAESRGEEFKSIIKSALPEDQLKVNKCFILVSICCLMFGFVDCGIGR